jgi:predicted GNAT family N-acyltransferase
MEGISIEQVQIGSPEYQRVYDLREAILRKPIGLSLADEDLSKEKNDIILAASLGNNIIGCLILTHKDEDTIKFRQMAIAEELQGKKIGNLLITDAENISRDKGYKKVSLHARETAAGFYSKLGYAITSSLFTEVGIPHYVMEKEL